MNTTDDARQHDRLAEWHLWLQSGVMLLLFITPQMPRQNIWFPFVLGLLSLFFFLAVEKDPRGMFRGSEERWLLAALFGFSGYLFLNSLWSQATPIALGKSLFVLLMILLTLLVSRTFARQSRTTLQTTARFVLIGAVIGSLIAVFEFATDHYLGRMLYAAVPFIRPGDKTIDVFVNINGQLAELPEAEFRKTYGDVIIDIASAALNRIHSLRMLLIWPLLFLAFNHFKPKQGLAFACVIVPAAVYSIFAGESQTAQAALVLSAAVFLLARYSPRVVHWGLLAAWCVAVVLALPLSAAPYKAGLYKSEWISPSFRDRMIIWGFTAEQAAKTPLFGVGIRSTRVIGKKLKKTQTQLPGHIVPRRLGLHSHNNFLQTWFELGAAGAAFLLALGIGLLHTIRHLGAAIRPYAYATFVSACVIAAFGWGLWQTWLLSGYALATIMVSFASACAAKSGVQA